VRHAMGVTVFAGMIGVTVFGLLLTPVFFVLVRRLTGSRVGTQDLPEAPAPLAIGPSFGNNPEVHGA